MNITEFRNYLEERIRVLGTELEECICARKALDRAEALSRPASQPKRLEAPRKLKRPAPNIDRAEVARIRVAILNGLPVHEWRSTRQVMEMCLAPEDWRIKVPRDRVYNVLRVLADKGLIVKDGMGPTARYKQVEAKQIDGRAA